MRQKCKYDKMRDFKEAAPNLSVNLSRAMEEKIVPGSGTEIEHNEIENSGNIGPRVTNNFDAIELQRSITAQGKADMAAEKAAKAAADAAKASAEAAKSTPQEGTAN